MSWNLSSPDIEQMLKFSEIFLYSIHWTGGAVNCVSLEVIDSEGGKVESIGSN